jgi:hypothetical protein
MTVGHERCGLAVRSLVQVGVANLVTVRREVYDHVAPRSEDLPDVIRRLRYTRDERTNRTRSLTGALPEQRR